MDPDLPVAFTPSAAGRKSGLVAVFLLSAMTATALAGCSRPEPPKEAGAAPAAAAPSAAPAAPAAEPVSLPEPDPAAAMRQAFVGPCRRDPPGPGPGPAPSADEPPGATEAEADLAQSIREESWADVRVGLYLGVDLPPDLAPSVRRRVRQEELVVELHEAAYLGDVGEIRRLLKLGADPNRAIAWANAATPLAMAAACNHADAVRALVAGGAKVDQTFAWWWPPRAAYTGSTALLFASLTGSVDAARALIELGADPNRRTMVDAGPRSQDTAPAVVHPRGCEKRGHGAPHPARRRDGGAGPGEGEVMNVPARMSLAVTAALVGAVLAAVAGCSGDQERLPKTPGPSDRELALMTEPNGSVAPSADDQVAMADQELRQPCEDPYVTAAGNRLPLITRDEHRRLLASMSASDDRQMIDVKIGPGRYPEGRTCIWKVGVVGPQGRKLTVFARLYMFGQALRANNTLIFADARGRYVGAYSLSGLEVRLVGEDIVFDDVTGGGNRIRVGKDGPPAKAWIDGEVVELFR